ncbi:hypothetical protein CCH79_00004932 [Gambusia affinis]|uniref:Uncharacterized protein n=1 Tax=Gambusia affinis TaxID=33528 RepID=A0A315V6B8_GAMAF|nr:hypothetical protein CCH79_00004932 [Gambusia affinis]
MQVQRTRETSGHWKDWTSVNGSSASGSPGVLLRNLYGIQIKITHMQHKSSVLSAGGWGLADPGRSQSLHSPTPDVGRKVLQGLGDAGPPPVCVR